MEENYKGIIIIAVIIVALFAGGLYYIFQENQNRKVTLNLVQEYIHTDDKEKQDSLEKEIELRIRKRSIALTSRASFDSFDTLINNANGCELIVSREQLYDPENQTRTHDEIWRDCMDHPEQLSNLNSPR